MKRILLVDDEQLITLAISKMIERSGEYYEVVGTASNGAEALHFLEHNPVDIALVDIQMPVLNGIGLLKRIHEKKLTVHVIILSAYRDFEYAQEALRHGADDYLLKPISQEALMQTLSKVSLQVDRDFAAKEAVHLFSYKRRQKAIYHLLENGKKDSDDLPAYFYSEETGCLLLLTGTIEFPLPFIEDCHNLGWEPYRDFQLIYFLPDNEADTKKILHIAKQTRALMDEYFLPSLTITHSNSGYSISDLNQALVECKIASMYAFYFPEKAVIAYSDIHMFGLTSIHPTVAAFEELHNYIKLSSKDNIFKQLKQIYQSLKIGMGLNPQTLYQLFYEMFMEFRILEKKQGNFNFFSDTTLSHLQSFISLDSLYEYSISLIQDYFDGTEPPSVNHDEQIIEQIKDFCLCNYATDCTLEDIASTVYISKNYLSQLFKEKCGISIWNYFTNIRIEKAKYLLSSSTIKVNQIGEMVGFKNPSHFGRTFRTHVGVSPKEYRLQIQGDSSK